MKSLKCAYCAGAFETDHPHKKYCSAKCRNKAASNQPDRKEYLRKWNREHAEYKLKWGRAHRKECSAATLRYQRKMYAQCPEKFNARNNLRKAVRVGRIAKPTQCQKCGGQERIQAHHHDYRKPFDVMWLCYRCHLSEHGKTLHISL